jgi:hypothetical protein
MRLIFTNTSGAGVQAALTGGEDFYLAADIYFGSTDTYAITSADSNHRIDIYGSVVSENGINLGDSGTDVSNRLFIHADGQIRAPDDNGSWGSMSLRIHPRSPTKA